MIQSGIDVNRRDHVGRTALHLAIMVRATEICFDLINAGARMSARLVDGRTCMHLAAQMDVPEVVQKLLKRSSMNAEAAKAKAKEIELAALTCGTKDTEMDIDGIERPSSEDDWDSETSDTEDTKRTNEASKLSGTDQPVVDSADMPEDDVGQPDVLDVNASDWDLMFAPLSHAIVSGSVRSVDLLLSAGADPQVATTTPGRNIVLHPLANTALTLKEDQAKVIMQRLLRAGAISSRADTDFLTVFHVLVCANKAELVLTVLQGDPKAKSVLNVPTIANYKVQTPLLTAVAKGNYTLVALLLAYGAKVTFQQEDWDSLITGTIMYVSQLPFMIPSINVENPDPTTIPFSIPRSIARNS